ncbi:MAG: hypothetical protein AAFQ60_15735, partial [Pseudomonadota bacterium]
MKLKDLGEIDTEVVLFGGPYSNLHATRALLDEVARLDAKAICTGDVVAYGADPSATLRPGWRPEWRMDRRHRP